jgi:hypothetical protein
MARCGIFVPNANYFNPAYISPDNLTVKVSWVRNVVCAEFDLESVAEVHDHTVVICARRATIPDKDVQGARGSYQICHTVPKQFRHVFAQCLGSITGTLAKVTQIL